MPDKYWSTRKDIESACKEVISLCGKINQENKEIDDVSEQIMKYIFFMRECTFRLIRQSYRSEVFNPKEQRFVDLADGLRDLKDNGGL